jgi:transcriptional regulator with XRE-family HTH domain
MNGRSYKQDIARGFLGNRLRLARAAKGLTQEQLATATKLQPSAIAHFEAGRRSPSAKSLRRLAVGLDMSIDWLLGLPTMPTRPS